MSSIAYPSLEELLKILGLEPADSFDWGSTPENWGGADPEARWTMALEAIRPTSRVGTLFGVTRRDLQNAAARLSQSSGGPVRRQKGKRAFDIIFSTAALLAVLPILLISAAAIKFTSRGPVFYRSERIGLNGKPFQQLKFRTMFDDADKQLEELLATNEKEGLLFKIRNDPRVTKVGQILRRFSIDELPEFFNVLRGEMSIVGPRPPLRREVEQYDDRVRRRLLVMPGITGLWQISGRYDLSWEDTVRLDLSYVNDWSMIGDLVIIGLTLKAVFEPGF
jgi:lipopolysaccharide/colanic/teichoic acid biosynthesis glycosyltransferase